jgi:serine/threonine protein phosphatase PrpC
MDHSKRVLLSSKHLNRKKDIVMSSTDTIPPAPRSDEDTSCAAAPAGGAVSVSVSEIQGRRESQEDNCFLGTIRPGDPLIARAAMLRAFQRVDATTSASPVSALEGATANMAMISARKDIVTVANIGDAPVYLYVLDERTGVVAAHQLTELHKPSNADEAARIRNAGGVIKVDNDGATRVQGAGSAASVTRAFGDKALRGVIADPYVAEYDISEALKAGNRVFLAASCDGLFEKGISPKDYAGILQDAWREERAGRCGRFENLAQKMTDYAYQRGSGDTFRSCSAKSSPIARKTCCWELLTGMEAPRSPARRPENCWFPCRTN